MTYTKEYEVFIGKNADKIISQFKKIDARSKKKFAWTPPVWNIIFFGPIWYFYRKMYVYGIILTLLPFIASFLEELLGFRLPSSVFIGLNIGYAFIGFSAYRTHVVKSVAKILQTTKNKAEIDDKLRAKGGVAVGVTALVIMLYILIIGFVVYSVMQNGVVAQEIQ